MPKDIQDIVRLFEQNPAVAIVIAVVVGIILLVVLIKLLGALLKAVWWIATLPFRIIAAPFRVLAGKPAFAPTWRSVRKDGTFVEGVKHSGEHAHYDPRGGSDVPVHYRDEKTGEGVDLRKTPLKELKKKGLIK